MVGMYQDDVSDEASRPLGINVEVEIDIWSLRYAMA